MVFPWTFPFFEQDGSVADEAATAKNCWLSLWRNSIGKMVLLLDGEEYNRQITFLLCELYASVSSVAECFVDSAILSTTRI